MFPSNLYLRIIKKLYNGDIISSKDIDCDVLNIEDAKEIFESLDYYELKNASKEFLNWIDKNVK